jgi:pyruvate kinase
VQVLDAAGARRTSIIARIQNLAGLAAIGEILDAADGVMVRGEDLLLEAPFWDLPAIISTVVSRANASGGPGCLRVCLRVCPSVCLPAC